MSSYTSICLHMETRAEHPRAPRAPVAPHLTAWSSCEERLCSVNAGVNPNTGEAEEPQCEV